ncbi:DUF4386 domain-containing protein [Arthrobacter pigmenti]
MSISIPLGSSQQGGLNQPAKPLRTPSLIAGVGLLLMTIFAVYGVFGPVDSLTTPGDPARTAADVAGSELLFRTGIASLIVVVVLDVIVAAALFEVFASVNRSVSMVAAWFRLAYSAVFLVAICQLLEVPALSDGEQILAAVNSFNIIYYVGLILFAVHLLLLGYLAYRSGFMAKIFGVLLVIAGVGYLADSFGTVLIAGFTPVIAQFVFVGEVALIFWLLIKGRRITAVQN